MTDFDKRELLRLPIKKLDEKSINQIAAGEVIERPAAAIKELIENSIDSAATSIEVSFSNGGKSFIKVIDNGCGIRKAELELALTSHATSKIQDSDLAQINSLGFRGEALSSIGAVSKLTIKSKVREEREAAEIKAVAGRLSGIKPVALSSGTSVEIRDLFFSTPARLKFLKSVRAETQAIFDTVKKLALSNPDVRFLLQDVTKEQKKIFLDLPEEKFTDKYYSRIEKILGTSFSKNCVELDFERNGYLISGFASLPTTSHGTTLNQHFFVNDRVVKDKLLLGALRAAYFDFISKDRFPAAVIFITCDPSLVDVNVHPMKSEVRFKTPRDIRGLIIDSLKKSLSKNGLKANSLLTEKALNSFSFQKQIDHTGSHKNSDSVEKNHASLEKQMSLHNDGSWFSGNVEESVTLQPTDFDKFPLGIAKAQLHENYILSQTKNGIIFVDQHAAHERITYERLKLDYQGKRVQSQDLLIPEIVELTGNQKEIVLEFSETLSKVGFVIEDFGDKAVCVRSIPALLGLSGSRTLIEDLIDELLALGQFEALERRVDAIISRISCHGSVRSGRKLNASEMNELLRQMEETPFSGQCNHGRPTFIELNLSDIEKLFGRS